MLDEMPPEKVRRQSWKSRSARERERGEGGGGDSDVKYGRNEIPLFWLNRIILVKSQILVDWKGLFQRNIANTNS